MYVYLLVCCLNNMVYVSDGLYVRLQQFKTVHTATGICETDTAVFLSKRYCCVLASMQTAVSVWQMPVGICTVLNCWWWTERPSETCRVSFQNKINLIHWVHLAGFTIGIYYDAQPYGRQICIISHPQNTTALQPDIFITGIRQLKFTDKERSPLQGGGGDCQGQLQTPQSVSICSRMDFVGAPGQRQANTLWCGCRNVTSVRFWHERWVGLAEVLRPDRDPPISHVLWMMRWLSH